MRTVVAATVLLSSSLAAFAAMPEQVQFVGSIQQDDLTPVTFDLHLPSKQSATLKLADGSTLELTTPGGQASPDGARIRLLSAAGQIMHAATVPDRSLASTSFAYRICNGQVTYMSPAPAVVPACGA
jgi:hypothetical protein